MANIVITNVAIVSHFDAKAILLLWETLAKKIVTNSDTSLLDKVHVRHFIFLVQNKAHGFLAIEFLGLETEADVIKELGLLCFIRVEKGTVLIDDVVEKVLDHNVFLYLARALIQVLVISSDTI